MSTEHRYSVELRLLIAAETRADAETWAEHHAVLTRRHVPKRRLLSVEVLDVERDEEDDAA